MSNQTPVQTRTYYNSGTLTIGRICIFAAAGVLLLFGLSVLVNTDKVSWGWIGVGLYFLGCAIG